MSQHEWSSFGRLRVGVGYDSHRLIEGRRLVLGGVEIDHPRGLEGHSDADVLAHAVTDAILGAAGAGDIGEHFPDDDDAWRDANSVELLARMTQDLPATLLNCDATVICEEPKIAPHRGAMADRLSAAARGHVSVKATTNEGMGAIGRGEGIACIAVAMVELR